MGLFGKTEEEKARQDQEELMAAVRARTPSLMGTVFGIGNNDLVTKLRKERRSASVANKQAMRAHREEWKKRDKDFYGRDGEREKRLIENFQGRARLDRSSAKKQAEWFMKAKESEIAKKMKESPELYSAIYYAKTSDRQAVDNFENSRQLSERDLRMQNKERLAFSTKRVFDARKEYQKSPSTFDGRVASTPRGGMASPSRGSRSLAG